MPSAGNKVVPHFVASFVAIFILLIGTAISWGQETKGSEDLDKAFDLKIKAQSTRDLDAVAKLCKSAIEKGLDDEGKIQAQQLASSALLEHANQLSQRIFSPKPDPRWQTFRTEALTRLEKAVEYQPELTAAYVLNARLNLLPRGDRDAAKSAIEKAVQFAGEDREQLSTALFMRASLSEDKSVQISDLNQAIKINPANTDAMRVRALYYLGNNQPADALKDLKQLLDSETATTQNYLDTAQLLMALGSGFDEKIQDEALKILEKALEREPENPQAFALRSQVYLMQENLEKALDDSSKAIKLDRKNPAQQRNVGYLTQRASIYLDLEKFDKALADINEALSLEPGLVRGFLLRGMIQLQRENYPAAIEDIKLIADNDPTNDAMQRQLAMVYNAADEPSQAIKIYDRLVDKYDPEKFVKKSNFLQLNALEQRSSALRGRGDARLSTGEHLEAVVDYEEAWKLSEELREIQQQETDEDIPADDGILNNLAWVLATSPNDKVRNGKRAIELATAAAEATEYKQAHILSTLASGYAESGDFDNATKWIEKAIEVNREESETKPSKHNTEQKESLQKELASYQKKEPWRELQNVEKEKAEAKKEKTGEDGAKEKAPKKPTDEADKAPKSDDKKTDSKKSDDKKPADAKPDQKPEMKKDSAEQPKAEPKAEDDSAKDDKSKDKKESSDKEKKSEPAPKSADDK